MGMEHYTKVRDLGGTNGAFLARDRQQPDRLVVIKRLADGTQGMEELNASLRLRHPHVIRFLESFLFNGALYVVMHYEQGGDLEELFTYLKERRKMPTTHTLLLWFVQLLEALAFCHANHIIHRDVKPSNILVSEDTKMLYLGDFGSAKALDTSNVTSTFVGSPLWIAPEVLMGTKYSFAADIWSLGCVFYEMATLRKPFSAPSFAHLVQQITRGQVAPLPPNVAPEVRAIVHSMLQLQPAARTTAAGALEVARAALAEAEVRRNLTPTPVRSPAPPANVSASSSPVQSTPVTPLVLSAPMITPPPQPQSHPAPPSETAAPSSSHDPSGNSSAMLRESQDDETTSVPPDTVAGPPTQTASSGVITPLTNGLDTATPANSSVWQGASAKTAARKKAAHIPVGGKSPTAATIGKSRKRGGASSPPSISTPSNKPPAVAAEETPQAEEAKDRSLTASTAEPCEPQQMVLNISTGAFRKPVARKKPIATRSAGTGRRPVAATAAKTPQLRQQVSSVPAPPVSGVDAPNFVRQPTAESLAGRRLSTTSAAEVVTEQRKSVEAQEPKVARKAAPPRALASRAKTAAESPCAQRHVPGESPTRVGAAGKPAPPEPRPMVPAGATPAKSASPVPADEWMDQRMRELSAMEQYLYQHRVDDNKVLQTYDARRNEEHQRQAARPPQHRSPAPRRLSPSSAFASPPRSPGVLVVSPPAPRKQHPPQQQRGCAGAAPADPRAGGAASPFLRQVSYARQLSHAGAASDSRQGSLASTFNGRQASNARLHQPITPEEHQRLEEERAAAREKREAERQRMKELIQEQRAAAKKQKHKPKKGSGEGGMEVDIVLPDRRRFAACDADGAAAAE
jgi:NIMA (never in mitosis gene a)-related kinase 1/4/5